MVKHVGYRVRVRERGLILNEAYASKESTGVGYTALIYPRLFAFTMKPSVHILSSICNFCSLTRHDVDTLSLSFPL